MKKEYLKPEVEYLAFCAKEVITDDTDGDGSVGGDMVPGENSQGWE